MEGKAKNDSWEDWLNESFAEFSALLVLRKVFGEEEFNRRINTYAQKAEDLPPVKGLDREDERAYQILYMKGPLILHKLEESIGRSKLEELLKAVHENNIDTTDKFLDKLKEVTSRKIRDKFNMLLIE